MKIYLVEIFIRDLIKSYIDDNENGVLGYSRRLNIRPPFQREFVYKDKQRDDVIKTIMNNFPLNVMYWIKNIGDTYELLDGQQRIVSICQYVTGVFSINYQYFHNLTDVEKDQILDYKLMVYFCEGTDKEKLDWFKIINIAGERLTPQEARNAIYTGQWLYEAKKWFSKVGCPAYGLADKYMKGTTIRQEYLETVIKWISLRDGLKEIEDYMAMHQHDPNANDLWLYFENVISWVKVIFPNYRKEMKGIEWGVLYNKYKDVKYDSVKLERRIKELIDDDEVQSKKGIYEFLLSGETDHRVLNLREFSDTIKAKVYEKQKGMCPMCDLKTHYEFKDMEADHIVPWNKGGKTIEENCKMLCMHHNRTKSGK
jgi:hypothetical protein